MAVLKLLRNKTLYATHDDALAAITQKAQDLGDGELWVATYGEASDAKSILALKRTDGLTVFDNEASSDAIAAAINELDATVGSTTLGSGEHVAVRVVQENGKLTALQIVEDDIASAALLGTTSDTQSNETAFGYIAKEVADRTAAIQALDKTDTPEDKKFVTSVSETDGIISVSRGAVTSTDKTLTLTDGSDGGINLAVNVDGTTIIKDNTNGTLSVDSSALTQYVGENAIDVSTVDANNEKTISLVIPNSEKVLSQDTNGLVTTIALKSVTPSSENVREEYQLQGINGQKLGTDTIKIYKDQTLKSATFANQILTLTYILADGSESAVNIDMSSIILETEVENGIQAIDHKLSIKLDTTGDDTGEGKFLTVGANGLKLDGVSDTITAAVNALDVPDTAETGQYVSQVSETDGKIAVERVNVSAAPLNGYVKGTDKLPLAAGDTINQAFSKLENTVNAANDEMLTNITGSNAVTVSAKTDKNQTVSLKLDAETKPQGFTNADNALSITSEGLYLSSIIDCGDY